jgi:cytochrome c
MKIVVPVAAFGLLIFVNLIALNTGALSRDTGALPGGGGGLTASATLSAVGDSTQAPRDTTHSAPAADQKDKKESASKTKDKTGAAAGPDKGIGPIKELKLDPIDEDLAAKGGQIFSKKCTVCHQLDSKKIGPPLRDVAKRQTPEFIMNMMLNADEMEHKDAYVKKLVSQLQTYMSISDLTKDDARAVLEYLRSQAEQSKPQ